MAKTKSHAVRLSDEDLQQLREKVESLTGQTLSESPTLSEMLKTLLTHDDTARTIESEAEVIDESEPTFPTPNCLYAGVFQKGKDVWVYCDNPKKRVERKTSEIPLSACILCERRETFKQEQEERMRKFREVPQLPPAIHEKPRQSNQYIEEKLRAADLKLRVGREDMLNDEERRLLKEFGSLKKFLESQNKVDTPTRNKPYEG